MMTTSARGRGTCSYDESARSEISSASAPSRRRPLGHPHGARAGRTSARRPPRWSGALVEAYGAVKLACAITNRSSARGARSCQPTPSSSPAGTWRQGRLTQHVPVDLLQGGAGRAPHVRQRGARANRACSSWARRPAGTAASPDGRSQPAPVDQRPRNPDRAQDSRHSPVAQARRARRRPAGGLSGPGEALAHGRQVGRTQLQDAVLTTLGRELARTPRRFAARPVAHLQWRSGCGTVTSADRDRAPRWPAARSSVPVVDVLSARRRGSLRPAENLIEATQNADASSRSRGFEGSATTLLKVCGDLRLLSSGPEAGLGEDPAARRQRARRSCPAR